MKPIEDQPGLPRVLLIGDSISIGYTPIVRENLKGKAEVVRPNTNCQHTAYGLSQIKTWLGDGKWDVIHFNFGLHDLKYLDAAGKYVPPDQGKQVASPEDHERNLRAIVARLKQTGAKLTQVDNLGKRRFPYVPRHVESGWFVNFLFEAEPGCLEKLQSRFKLNESIYQQYYQRQ